DSVLLPTMLQSLGVAPETSSNPIFGSLVNRRMTGFFFQADHGIRDGHVTGVQTCALPISHCCRYSRGWAKSLRLFLRVAPQLLRSEERRVGKECRSGWAAHRYTKTVPEKAGWGPGCGEEK